VLGAQALGAVLGGLVMLRWRPTRPMLVATVVTLLWAWPLLALAHVAPLWVIAVGALVAGVGFAIFGTLWNTTLQREVPEELLSRVSAYDWFGSLVFLPIGFALVGPIERAVGLSETFVGATVIFVVLVLATLCAPSVTRLRAPGPLPTAEASVG
jgi:MFS family permease